VNEQIHSH